jgi:hypothetical protein
MTKIAFIADPHIGNFKMHGGRLCIGVNQRCSLALDTLYDAVKLAQKEGCSIFVVAGDLFDTHNPLPQIIAEVQDIFEGPPDRRPLEMYFIILSGNHDLTSYSKHDHALGPLQTHCNIFDEPSIYRHPNVDLILVPQLEVPANLASVLNELIKEKRVKNRILVMHTGIIDYDTPHYLHKDNNAIHIDELTKICVKHDISLALSGHWHRHKTWERQIGGDEEFKRNLIISQIGALCPTGWKDGGFKGYGKVLIWNTDAMCLDHGLEIPGPRFMTITMPNGLSEKINWGTVEENCEKEKKKGNKVFLRATTPAEHVSSVLTYTQNKYVDSTPDNKLFFATEVHPDSTRETIAAREAASAASKEHTLEKAIDAFIENMTLEKGVSREAVLNKVKEYLDG